MFALEITFRDGVSNSEMVLVRRPQAVVGASEHAHVVIEDMKQLGYELRFVKGLGSSFRSQPLGLQGAKGMSGMLEGVYNGQASFDLGNVSLQVAALDSDLAIKDGEPPDRAGVRVLRQACVFDTPRFPAIMVSGAQPVIVSFAPDQPLYVGRSKRCALRLDSADISGEHARIGFESGEFWVEDLGSTNGTYVNGQQISGRQRVASGVSIVLGRETTIVGITAESQIQIAGKGNAVAVAPRPEESYPVLFSISELVRPARVSLRLGSSLTLGRDPMSDIWIGSPHVSRKHAVLSMSKTGSLSVIDHSTNGLAMNGVVLARATPIALDSVPAVFDFGGGVHIAICFDPQQEKAFAQSNGAISAFVSAAVNRVEPRGAVLDHDRRAPAPDLSDPSTDQTSPRKVRVTPRQLISSFASLGVRQRILFVVGIVCICLLVVVVLNVLASKPF